MTDLQWSTKQLAEIEKNRLCSRLVEWAANTIRRPIYTGPNVRWGDYYVREVRRSGTERRSVYLSIVGTDRVIRVGRRDYERVRRAG